MTVRNSGVLVIEQDAALRDILATVLQDEGYPVQTAADEREALVRLQAQSPALILFDLPLKMDLQALQQVGAQVPFEAIIPIVILSDDRMVLHLARRVGADGWLHKPIKLDALLDMVELYCSPLQRPPEGQVA